MRGAGPDPTETRAAIPAERIRQLRLRDWIEGDRFVWTGDNANGPGYPGPLRTWCSSLSTSVFVVVETMSSYSGRLSLRSLPVIDLLHRWENGPGGIRTRIRASLLPSSPPDRELCYRLHHGPSREFREPRGSLQGWESQ